MRFVILIIAASVLNALAAMSHGDDIVKLNNDIRSAFHKWHDENPLAAVQQVYRKKTFQIPPGAPQIPEEHSQLTLWRDGARRKVETHSMLKEQPTNGTAIILNSQYSASLVQKVRDGAWSVDEMFVGPVGENPPLYHHLVRNYETSVGCYPWMFFDRDLLFYLENGKLKVESQTIDGSIVEATVTFDDSTRKVHGTGVLKFDRSKGMLPLAQDIAFTTPAPGMAEYSMLVECAQFQEINGVFVPFKWKRTTVMKGVPFVEESLEVSEAVFDRQFRPKDFTLTAFGLPEPPGTNLLQATIPYWLIAMLGGVVLIGLGFFLRKRFSA